MSPAPRLSLRAAARAAAVLLGLAAASSAQALCTLACTCSASTTSVVFAAHNPLVAANNDSVGSIRISCGGTVGLAIPYSVALSAGGSGSIGARRLFSGAAQLSYNVYTTNSFTTIWGDGTGASAVVNGGVLLDALGLAPPQNLAVYARIPGSQIGVAPGSYSDALVVTLTYY